MHSRVRALPVVAALAGAALAVTAGCGGSANQSQSGTTPTAPASTTPSPTALATAAADVKEITIRVADGRVDPAPGRVDVRQGQRVRLRVSSDRADEVHVHLYDRSQHVPAGGTATIEFVADVAGLAEVELEEAHKQLVQLVIQ